MPHRRGEDRATAKLTSEQVIEVFSLFRQRCEACGKPRFTQRELALRFGVSTPTIHNILARKNWTHITDELDPSLDPMIRKFRQLSEREAK